MKKIVSLLCCLLLVGCTINSNSQKDYDENKDNNDYVSLIKDINQYKNEYTDADYEGEELCNHPRGEYKTDELTGAVWSEPHIHNTYYIDIVNTKTNESNRIYFDGNNLNAIEKILVDTYGFTKLN